MQTFFEKNLKFIFSTLLLIQYFLLELLENQSLIAQLLLFRGANIKPFFNPTTLFLIFFYLFFIFLFLTLVFSTLHSKLFLMFFIIETINCLLCNYYSVSLLLYVDSLSL